MNLNINLGNFKKNHKLKKNQVLYLTKNTNGENEINNLIDSFLYEKNSFIFESVEKGMIKFGNLIIILEKLSLRTSKKNYTVIQRKL